MNCTLLILVVSIFSFTLNLIFFFRKHIKTKETKIFSYLLVVNFIGLIVELVCAYIGYNYETNNLFAHIFTKIYLIYLMTYLFIMTLYVYSIAYMKKNEDYYNKLKLISYVIYAIFCLVVLLLPIKTEAGFATGYSVSFVYIVSTLCMMIWLIPIVKNFKLISKKKIIPFFCLMVFMSLVALLQKIYPTLTLITVMEFFVIFIMYHTIENPDLKIIEELKKNRSLTSKSYIEKSNFLFRMSAEVRKPIENIKELNDYNLDSDNLKEIKENSKEIDLNLRNANFTINNVLDVTSLDTKNINITNNKYNIYKLLKEIKLRESKKINNIRFEFNISENLPEYLYGDSIRLKNILMCILDKSIERTNTGFIEVNVNSINKYDICRLIITIEDSSLPLSLEEINNILDNDKEIDENNITIYDINKLINMMNGNLMIKSEEGNEFLLSIDSKILNPKTEEITNDTDILFISNNNKLLKNLEILFNEYTSNSVLNGIDAIDLIRAGENYNLILIDDVMKPISGLETLKKLRSLDINIPCIIMLDKDKGHIKNHYIKDGFIDYILKDDLKNEMERVIKKYL
mgnify:CR=1 FL=1